MSDYIKREDALNELTRLCQEKFSLNDLYQIYLNALIDVESALHRIPSADVVERNQWISVKDKLPEIEAKILCVGMHGKSMFTAKYTGGISRNGKDRKDKVCTQGLGWRTFTHWMPLPEPPKGEQNET